MVSIHIKIRETTMTTQITAETLSPIAYQNTAVVTTELLARLYGAEIKHIQNNYLRNADRFTIGKHFYKLEGAELKEFKDKPSLRGLVAKRAKHFILWTERGAARHAKMLETDQAWDVFEKLEDCYFNQRQPAPQPISITPEQQQAIKQLVQARTKSLPAEHQPRAAITLWSALKNHFGRSYKEIEATQFNEALALAIRLPLTGEVMPAPQDDDRESVDNVMLLTDANYRTQALDYIDDLLTRCSDYAEANGIDVTRWNPANYELAASGLLADLLRHTRAELSFDSFMRPVLKMLPPGALYLSPQSDEAMRGLVSRVVSTETLMGMMNEGLARLDRERKAVK